jgi:hypothetical protein
MSMKLKDATLLRAIADDLIVGQVYRRDVMEELLLELVDRYLIPDLAHEEDAEAQAAELAEIANNPNV